MDGCLSIYTIRILSVQSTYKYEELLWMDVLKYENIKVIQCINVTNIKSHALQ